MTFPIAQLWKTILVNAIHCHTNFAVKEIILPPPFFYEAADEINPIVRS